MKNYNVYIEIDGQMNLIGFLNGTDDSDTRFKYCKEYLDLENPKAISVSLPLQEEYFSVHQTKNFFEGLLPEGFTRQTLANRIRKDENDYIGLLSIVGRECIGAMMINEADCNLSGEYIPVDAATIKALALEGATKSAEIISKTHLSLAGATGKVGLYLDEKMSKWFLPQGLAPSTHIIKQSHVRYSDIVVNEALCMNIARKCGIDVPDSFIINTGNKQDSDILFAVKRFDRYVEGCKVHRLHQEDFGQAMSIHPSQKYELDGSSHMTQMFETIKNNCANPILDQAKLFKLIAFNVLIGNTDAHVKNYSLVYDKYLGNLKLSPAYDLLCTAYHGSTNMLSFNINGKYDITELKSKDLLNAAHLAGVGTKITSKIFDELCEAFETNVKDARDELLDQGFDKAANIAQVILKNADGILE